MPRPSLSLKPYKGRATQQFAENLPESEGLTWGRRGYPIGTTSHPLPAGDKLGPPVTPQMDDFTPKIPYHIPIVRLDDLRPALHVPHFVPSASRS